LFILISQITSGTSKVTKQAAAAMLQGPDSAAPVPIAANTNAIGITPNGGRSCESGLCQVGQARSIAGRVERDERINGAHEFDTLCTALDIEHRLTPPKSPQTNGMVERFNGRIEEVLQSHRFRSGEELETTLHRYVWLYNQQLPQSALCSKSPLQAMKDWHKLKPELFKKQPYYLPGCDS